MGTQVTFFGADNVVNAFESRKIETWAVFQGKDLLQPGTGAEELEQLLDSLQTASPNATYKLKVYKQEIDPDSITDKTANSGAFTFKLTGSASSMGSMGSQGGDWLTQRFRAALEPDIEAMIERKFSGKADDDEDTWMGKINGVLSDPTKLEGVLRVINAIKGIFVKDTPPVQNLYAPAMGHTMNLAGMQPAPATVGKVHRAGEPLSELFPINKATTVEAVNENGLTPTQEALQIRLANAIDILGAKDPLIVEHLEKLAKVAKEQPSTFQFILAKINDL